MRRSNDSIALGRARWRAFVGVRGLAACTLVALVVSACSGSSSVAGATATDVATATATAVVATATPAPTPVATDTPVATLAPGASLATAVPTAIDPCQLITSAEASSLAGASFGPGKESTTSGNVKQCVYGSQSLNVFTVSVGQAPDVATAQAGKAQAEADLTKLAAKGVKFTELPNFADGAAYYTGSVTYSGATVNASAIYALKGTTFFGFSDLALGHPTPDGAALQAEAQTLLGRLP